MKTIILTILATLTAVPSAIIAAPVTHSHGGKEHTHALPEIGVKHRHNGSSEGSTSSSSVTKGDKSHIIHNPKTVIFNNFAENKAQPQNANEHSSHSESKAQTNKSMLASHGDAEITLKSCTQKSQTVKCFLSIKNTADTDINYIIDGRSFIIDHKGNQYPLTKREFGNQTATGQYRILRKLLLPNLPVDIVLSYSVQKSNGDIIPLLRFDNSSKTDFRNIPISR